MIVLLPFDVSQGRISLGDAGFIAWESTDSEVEAKFWHSVETLLSKVLSVSLSLVW